MSHTTYASELSETTPDIHHRDVPSKLPEPYYQDSEVTLYHGDCYKLLPLLEKPHLLIADPPYEIECIGGKSRLNIQYLNKISQCNLYNGFDVSILDSFDNWCVFCSKRQLKKLLADTGSRRWELVTWNKTNPPPTINGKYLPDTEYIVHAFRRGRLFGDYKDKSHYIVHPIEQHDLGHPTVKPLPVVSKMVRLGSQEGDTICDPFAGSGTTLVAAKLLHRRAVGIEINERFCEIAARRLSQGVLKI